MTSSKRRFFRGVRVKPIFEHKSSSSQSHKTLMDARIEAFRNDQKNLMDARIKALEATKLNSIDNMFCRYLAQKSTTPADFLQDYVYDFKGMGKFLDNIDLFSSRKKHRQKELKDWWKDQISSVLSKDFCSQYLEHLDGVAQRLCSTYERDPYLKLPLEHVMRLTLVLGALRATFKPPKAKSSAKDIFLRGLFKYRSSNFRLKIARYIPWDVLVSYNNTVKGKKNLDNKDTWVRLLQHEFDKWLKQYNERLVETKANQTQTQMQQGFGNPCTGCLYYQHSNRALKQELKQIHLIYEKNIKDLVSHFNKLMHEQPTNQRRQTPSMFNLPPNTSTSGDIAKSRMNPKEELIMNVINSGDTMGNRAEIPQIPQIPLDGFPSVPPFYMTATATANNPNHQHQHGTLSSMPSNKSGKSISMKSKSKSRRTSSASGGSNVTNRTDKSAFVRIGPREIDNDLDILMFANVYNNNCNYNQNQGIDSRLKFKRPNFN